MSWIVDKIIDNYFVSQNFNDTKQDFISAFPDELVLDIFSHVHLVTLGRVSLVSRKWKQLASNEELQKIVIYRKTAFGNDKWAQCFGKDVVKDEDSKEEWDSLPWQEFIEDSKKFKSIYPEENALDNLMLVRLPKTLNGGLTLRLFGELAKKYFPNSANGYRFICPLIDFGDKPIDKSRWVQMTTKYLPGGKNQNYGELQKAVAQLAEKSLIGYEVPDALESVVCILSQYFDSETRLFKDDPSAYTICKENAGGIRVTVGGFSKEGLIIGIIFGDGMGDVGVAAMRKF